MRVRIRAVTWHGIEDVRVTEVPDPSIVHTTDAIVRVTSTAICGSDLHLYTLARRAVESAGLDRLVALHAAIRSVRRGGTVSISGVYGGTADPMPMMDLFDKGLSIRMGQCRVRRWTEDRLDIVLLDDDVLGLEDLATHLAPLEEAPDLSRTFQEKQDGCLEVVLTP